MCFGCWEEYEKPENDSAEIRATVVAVAKVYEFSSVGGNLHIAIDDWNIDDDSLDSCERFIKENSHEASAEQIQAEKYCLELLRQLTEIERASALARYDGFAT